MQDNAYDLRVKQASPDSPILKNCLFAFLTGGAISAAGEWLFTRFTLAGANEKNAAAYVSVLLIVLTAALTGIGVFDSIAKTAGAGTLVPITGFANAVAAPAIEYSTEGRVLGTAVKMFTIAGPVIVFGTAAAWIYGCVYYFFLR